MVNNISAPSHSFPNNVFTIDLNFLNKAGAIAVYALEHTGGIILIECGPSSTLPTLFDTLHKYGHSPDNITDVLLTHIHLDHAGAAGTLARKGACIHVHPNGAPHLIEPTKLISSAQRIYGEMMKSLWGVFEPVPENKLSILNDGDTLTINEVSIKALDTPGHAEHHNCYVFKNICFTGDIGGVRIGNTDKVILPTPPPEFHLEKWRESLEMIRKLDIDFIAPTHFGIFENPQEHIQYAKNFLDDLDVWLNDTLPASFSFETLSEKYHQWFLERISTKGNGEHTKNHYESVNPLGMSASGIYRYWNKVRNSSLEHH